MKTTRSAGEDRVWRGLMVGEVAVLLLCLGVCSWASWNGFRFVSTHGAPSWSALVSILFPCVATTLLAGILAVALARGWVPGGSLKEWSRSRRIVLWAVGATCSIWLVPAAITAVASLANGEAAAEAWLRVAMMVALFTTTCFCWPRSPLPATVRLRRTSEPRDEP